MKKNTLNNFSLFGTLLPNFRWTAAIMYSSRVRSCNRWSFCVMYADCLRNVLTSCFSPLTLTQPSIPSFLPNSNPIHKVISVYIPEIYFKPASIFINEVFPAPDGPRIAVNCPELKAPLILCKIRIAFFPSDSA
jgi:hypothetical protein